jgi:hypothetical protein
MTDDLSPRLTALMRQYARDLGQLEPSSDLDARIGGLVAGHGQKFSRAPRRRSFHVPGWAIAASFALLAICAGMYIGIRVEHSRQMIEAVADVSHGPAWPPADLSMFPTNSVSLQIPAVYSSQGKLVAVDPKAEEGGKRYWIDVVVSNDGTFRIEKIVPAESKEKNSRSSHDGVQLQGQ